MELHLVCSTLRQHLLKGLLGREAEASWHLPTSQVSIGTHGPHCVEGGIIILLFTLLKGLQPSIGSETEISRGLPNGQVAIRMCRRHHGAAIRIGTRLPMKNGQAHERSAAVIGIAARRCPHG